MGVVETISAHTSENTICTADDQLAGAATGASHYKTDQNITGHLVLDIPPGGWPTINIHELRIIPGGKSVSVRLFNTIRIRHRDTESTQGAGNPHHVYENLDYSVIVLSWSGSMTGIVRICLFLESIQRY